MLMPKFVTSKAKPRGKGSIFATLTAEAKPHLMGRVLSIDPSSGSASSKPGFAYFEGGVLKELGDLNIPGGIPLWLRLKQLGQELRANWPNVDVLIIENIPPFMASKGRGGKEWRNAGVVNLHKSIGAILASVEATTFVEVTPMTWHKFAAKDIPAQSWYEKCDALDALMMALTTFNEAGIKVDYSSAFGGVGETI
jgi:hypothetical protein